MEIEQLSETLDFYSETKLLLARENFITSGTPESLRICDFIKAVFAEYLELNDY
jgi:hypothetical protein